MVRQHHQTLYIIWLLTDVLCLIPAWGVAYIIRCQWHPLPPPFYPMYFKAIFVISLISSLIFKSYGNYSVLLKDFSLAKEVWNIFYIVTMSFATVLALSFFYRDYEYSRVIAVLFWGLSIFFLAFNRILLRYVFLILVKKGYYSRRAIIVGAGNLGRSIGEAFHADAWGLVKIIGYIDDNHQGEEIIGKLNDLEKIIDQHSPDYLYLALPCEQYGKMQRIMKTVSESLVSVRMVADILSWPTLRTGISDFYGYPIIHITDSPLDESWNLLIKRIFDILFSTCVLVFLSPLLFLLAIAVKLSSKGPILYRQQRMGLDGQVFDILKFRTMPVNAEENTGPIWASDEDKRPTKLGAFLRKTSLDELPQFWNVLKGEMSVVGPRPERPIFIDKFKREIPKYMLRHKMKAGITGWAQINGWRGNTSLVKRIDFDLYYIENWSMVLDLKIIFLTLFRGFIHENAY